MAETKNKVSVYIESGKKKTFAGAVDWPGWCRSARDEGTALQTLAAYGERYARALRLTNLSFRPPRGESDLEIVTRLEGNSTTDYGAPDMPLPEDDRPLADADFKRLTDILQACWQSLDESAAAAEGRVLRKGPRGGGRELDDIVRHVSEADLAYLGQLGWKTTQKFTSGKRDEITRIRQEILRGLESSAAGELPKVGPRGGLRWTVRRFVRRSAWHVLDHAWEVEDRVE